MNNQFEFRRLIRKRVQQLFVRVQSRWRAVSVTGLVFIVLHARCRHTNLRRTAPVIFFNCLMSRTYLWMSRFSWDPTHALTECEDAPKIWTWNSTSNNGHTNIKWDCRLYRIKLIFFPPPCHNSWSKLCSCRFRRFMLNLGVFTSFCEASLCLKKSESRQ